MGLPRAASAVWLVVAAACAHISKATAQQTTGKVRTPAAPSRTIVAQARQLPGTPSSPGQDQRAARATVALGPKPLVLGARDLLPVERGRRQKGRARGLRGEAFLFVEAKPPSAVIYLDGVAQGVGQAFVEAHRGEPRYRAVRVEADGYEPVEGYAVLTEGEVSRYRIPLERKGARLSLITDRPGAKAEIDEVPVGATPITVELEPGVHRIRLSLGSWEWRGTIEARVSRPRIVRATVVTTPEPAPPVATQAHVISKPRAPAPSSQTSKKPEPKQQARSQPNSGGSAGKTVGVPKKHAPVHQHPQAQSKATRRVKPKCRPICQKFASAIGASEAVQEPVRRRCTERCDVGDLRFAICAWRARNVDDVQRCMLLPEQSH